MPAGPEPVNLPSGLVRELTRFSSRRRPVWECDISHATTLRAEVPLEVSNIFQFGQFGTVPSLYRRCEPSPKLPKTGSELLPRLPPPTCLRPVSGVGLGPFCMGFLLRPATVVSKRMFLLNQPMLTTYPLLASLRGKIIFFLMPRWNVSISGNLSPPPLLSM